MLPVNGVRSATAPPWRGDAAVVAALGLVAVSAAAAGLGLAVSRGGAELGNLALTAAPLAAAAAAWAASRTATAGARTAWRLLAIGELAAVIGQVWWSAMELGLGQTVAFPSAAFYLFLVFHLCFAGAAVAALRPARVPRLAAEIALDGLLVLLGAAVLVVRGVLEPPLLEGWISRGQAAAMLAGQVAAIGSFLFTGLLLIWRDTELPLRSVASMYVAAALFLVGNILVTYGLDPDPARPGDAFDLIWLAGWIGLAAGGLLGIRGRAEPPSGRRELVARRIRQVVIPAAALFLAVVGIEAASTPPVSTEFGIVLGLLGLVLAARIANALFAAEWQAERRRRAESAAAEARLRAIRAQLNPHFLFNALHSVSSLLRGEPSRAEGALEDLGDLLRYSLREGSGTWVHFAEEWEFTRSYLEIERLRLGDRLRLSMEMDEEAADWRVPPFLLQPLTENAVRHGLARCPGGGELSVRARVDGDVLRLSVRDSGAGADAAAIAAGGIGLRAVRSQLEARWGDRASISIQTSPGRGFHVELALPESECQEGGADEADGDHRR